MSPPVTLRGAFTDTAWVLRTFNGYGVLLDRHDRHPGFEHPGLLLGNAVQGIAELLHGGQCSGW